MTGLLHVAGVSRNFGGNRALDGVELSLREGETVGIIGPNGSGKTTLFNVITGFVQPSSGRVHWQGRDVTRVAAFRRARLGLVRTFQEKMVFPDNPVRENVQLALLQRGERHLDDAAVLREIESVGLPRHTLAQRAGDLSWGQCRLLGMALALALRPRMLLLDEPFAGLNRVAAGQVTALLRRLREQGIACVIVEHEMSLLLPLCDRVAVMANGTVLAEGRADDILQREDVRAAYFGVGADAAD